MKKILIFNLLIIVFYSCRKDETVNQYSGFYLVEYDYDYDYSGSDSRIESDRIIEIEQDGDTLRCFGSKFIISSKNQTFFNGIVSGNNTTYPTLSFSNNYTEIAYSQQSSSQSSGPSSTTNFSGTQTTLMHTDEHAKYDELIGWYDLEVQYYHYLDSIDTSYSLNTFIDLNYFPSSSYSTFKISIDSNEFSVNEFVSHLYYSKQNNSSNTNYTVNWSSDSFYYHERHTDWLAPVSLQEEWLITGSKQ